MSQYDKTKFRRYEVNVGDIFETNHWGNVSVVCAKNTNSLTVQFLNTGNLKTCRASELRSGGVEDTEARVAGVLRQNYISPQRASAFMSSGEIYPSNFWGDMKIVEYISSKEVVVKFLNSGNIQTTQRYAILDGHVKDQKAEKEIIEKRNAEIALERAGRISAEKSERELRNNLEKRSVEEGIASRRRWYAMMRDLKCNVDSSGKLLCGKRLCDRDGQIFQVRSKKSFNSTLWFIVYESSGNGYWVPESAILETTLYDKNTPDAVAKEKLRRKQMNAERYEANRAHYIAKADAYQRNNVERTRVRNRNRRALREGAEGRHTLEQVLKLLLDQDNQCSCCGVELTDRTRELDHKMPLVLGGSNWIENLQWLCQFCNGSKNGSHPDEWEAYTSSDSFKKRRLDRLVNDSEDWLVSLETMPKIHEYFKRC